MPPVWPQAFDTRAFSWKGDTELNRDFEEEKRCNGNHNTPVLPGRVDGITKEELDAIIAAGLSEGPTLDLKRALPLDTPAAKQEFARDVVAFANRLGGDLVIGVEETKGIASAAIGVPIPDKDAFELQIQQIVRDSIRPRLAPLRVGFVDGYPGGSVVVIRIGASASTPHLARSDGLTGFYARHGRQNVQMDIEELRRAFAASDSLRSDINEFLQDRIEAINEWRAQEREDDGPRCIIHILPLDLRHHKLPLSLKEAADLLEKRLQADFRAAQWRDFVSPIYRLEGLYVWEPRYNPLLILRSGAIEFSRPVGYQESSTSPVLLNNFSLKWLYSDIFLLLKVAVTLETVLPVMVSLSYVGLSETRFGVSHFLSRHLEPGKSVMELDKLVLPPVLIEDDSVTQFDIAELVKPALDMLVQCYGFSEWETPKEFRREAIGPSDP